MKITGSTNIKSFGKNESYRGLQLNHFDLKDREKKGISKDENLEKLNKHFAYYSLNNFYKSLEENIEKYNSLPSQVKNKSRRYKDLSDYVENRRNRKKVDKKFHGLEYMMVSKVGSMESWEDVVKTFNDHGVSEEDTLNSLNSAFNAYCKNFNDTYSKHGLMIIESDTNLDENGAPHLHARVLLNKSLKNGLPDTNLANALKSRYGQLNNKELMERFRLDLDNSLIDLSSQALVNLAHERGFDFDGLELTRLESEEKGLTHEAYKERREFKRRQAEVHSQEQRLKDDEIDLIHRKRKVENKEKELNDRESSLKASEDNLKQREANISIREEEARRVQDMASRRLKEAEDIKQQANEKLNNAEQRLEDIKILKQGFPNYLKSKVHNSAFYELIDKSANEYENIQRRQSSLIQQGEQLKQEMRSRRRQASSQSSFKL